MGSGAYGEDHKAREAIQAAIVAEIFSRKVEGLVLKGGLAFRALTGSARMTKDIDLDSLPSFSKLVHQQALRMAIKRAACESGLADAVSVTEPKQTDTTMRWKISGRLRASGEPLHLTVEVSRREPLCAEEAGTCRAACEGFGEICVYSKKALCAMKALSMTDPRRSAPRDAFDLWLLVEAGVESPAEILGRASRQQLLQSREELWPKLESFTWDRFKEEIAPFMQPQERSGWDERRWTEALIGVGEALDEWFAQAAEAAGELEQAKALGAPENGAGKPAPKAAA